MMIISSILGKDDTATKHVNNYGNRIPKHIGEETSEEEEKKKDDELKTELHEAAFKIASYYVRVYDFMDKDIDDSISKKEIKDIYENFHWAMFPDKTPDAMA